MNIGVGLIAMVFAILFLIAGVVSLRNNDKAIGIGSIITALLALSLSLMLTGMYDPYANHIKWFVDNLHKFREGI